MLCVAKALIYKRTWRVSAPLIFQDNDLNCFGLLISVPSVNTNLGLIRYAGRAETIFANFRHLKLTDIERQIIANRVITMIDEDVATISQGERAILDFFGLRPEPPRPLTAPTPSVWQAPNNGLATVLVSAW